MTLTRKMKSDVTNIMEREVFLENGSSVKKLFSEKEVAKSQKVDDSIDVEVERYKEIEIKINEEKADRERKDLNSLIIAYSKDL